MRAGRKRSASGYRAPKDEAREDKRRSGSVTRAAAQRRPQQWQDGENPQRRPVRYFGRQRTERDHSEGAGSRKNGGRFQQRPDIERPWSVRRPQDENRRDHEHRRQTAEPPR